MDQELAPSPPTDAEESTELAATVRLLMAITALFACAHLALGRWLGHSPFYRTAAIHVGLLGALTQAYRLARKGRRKASAEVTSYALLAAVLAGAPLVPSLFPALAVVPVLVVALALPHLGGRSLRLLSVAAAGVSLAVGAIGAFARGREPTVFEGMLLEGSLGAAVLIALFQLGAFSGRIERTLASIRRSEEALRNANQRKDHFLAVLGHELRNPLAAIQMTAELLHPLADTEPLVAKTTGVIRRHTDQLASMLDELFEISRITSGKFVLHKQVVRLDSVVRQAVESIGPLLKSKEQQLEVQASPPQISLEADPVRLVQAIVNLLTNSAKYTPPGGRIALSASQEAGQIVFRVKDTGVGIAPEMLNSIFELFVQANDSLDRSQGGLGLGLPIVRRIVELHGGTVSADSRGPGEGSEFLIRIPVGNVEEEKAMLLSHPPLSRRRRVLVVDDNRDFAHGLARGLSISGHDVREAYDGPAALKIAEDFQPEVAFVDIGLPLLDGFEVARQMRRIAGAADLSLIALTGYGESQDRERSKEAGFNLHLVKPVDLGRVKEVIASLPGPPTA
jgi:signal transduction histidine kinase